ncbi:MAG TPA: hypothetical protein VGB43_06785 [Flavobacterium sp.]|jgi:hypothetical protein
MKTLHSSPENFQKADADLKNIIRINSVNDIDAEEFDFDFDYDPNEMYYALANENKLAG